jgi:hypothetical protein
MQVQVFAPCMKRWLLAMCNSSFCSWLMSYCVCWMLLQINTLALWNMGRMIEPLLGSKPFLTVYLGSGEVERGVVCRCIAEILICFSCGTNWHCLFSRVTLHSTEQRNSHTIMLCAVCCGLVCRVCGSCTQRRAQAAQERNE